MSTVNIPAFGPGLMEVLEAQRRNDEIVSWPHLEGYARGLVALGQELGASSVIWPVDAAAERLAGAAALLAGPGFRIREWGQLLEGEHVLLVAVVALSPLPLIWAARQASALGASSVAACGIDIGGIEGFPGELDDVIVIRTEAELRRRSA